MKYDQIQERPQDTYRPFGPIQQREGSASAMLVIPRRPTPATAFWENQSITVRAPDGGGVPRPEVPNRVSVAIRNIGWLSALNVTVEFRYLAPSTSPTTLTPIALVNNVLIGPGHEANVHCMWTPHMINGIHQCLLVTCWALNDMRDLQPWQPATERRCAQRNVSVIEMSAGAMMKSSLEFANVLPIHALTQLVGKVDQVRMVAERPGKVMSSDFLSQVLKATSGAATIREAKDPRFEQMTMSREMTRSALPPLRAQLTESLGTFAPRDANRQLANLLMAGEAATRACSSGAVAGMTTLKEAMLHPFELRRVEFQVGAPQDARPGDLFVYRFAQIAENMVLGGYTVVVQVTR